MLIYSAIFSDLTSVGGGKAPRYRVRDDDDDDDDDNNNNINNNQDDIYRPSAVIMTTCHCESSLGSFVMNCRTAHKRPSTLRRSHLTWAVSPPVGSYRLQPPSPFIIITQPES